MNASYQCRVLTIGTVEHVLHCKNVAHRCDVARDRTVAERYQQLGAHPNFADLLKVFLIGHCSFNEGDIGLREILIVGQGTGTELHACSKIEQSLVQIKERHVAAGTSPEPDSGESRFLVHSVHWLTRSIVSLSAPSRC